MNAAALAGMKHLRQWARSMRAATARFSRRWSRDLLLIAGVACLAIAASYAGAAWSWLVVGAYLFWTGWTLARSRRGP